jgi:hypothetical protein
MLCTITASTLLMPTRDIISDIHLVVRLQSTSLDTDRFLGNDVKEVRIEVDSVFFERGTFDRDIGSNRDAVSRDVDL